MNVIISGGSKGLGLYLVKKLLAENFKVATFARSETKEIKQLLNEFGDEQFIFEEIDILNYAKTREFVNYVNKKFEKIDCLINNAAIGQDHFLTGIKDEKIIDIININLSSAIILTKYVVKKMFLSGTNSQIINISSICADKGFTALTAYSATKGGINSFTKSLARELGERRILVNSISPGFFESEMSAILSDEQLNTIKRRTPTGELVAPEHISNMVLFLLKNDTNITGQNFVIDGGSII